MKACKLEIRLRETKQLVSECGWRIRISLDDQRQRVVERQLWLGDKIH